MSQPEGHPKEGDGAQAVEQSNNQVEGPAGADMAHSGYGRHGEMQARLVGIWKRQARIPDATPGQVRPVIAGIARIRNESALRGARLRHVFGMKQFPGNGGVNQEQGDGQPWQRVLCDAPITGW